MTRTQQKIKKETKRMSWQTATAKRGLASRVGVAMVGRLGRLTCEGHDRGRWRG